MNYLKYTLIDCVGYTLLMFFMTLGFWHHYFSMPNDISAGVKEFANSIAFLVIILILSPVILFSILKIINPKQPN